MKGMIVTIVCTVLFLVMIPVYCAFAENNGDSEPMGEEAEYVYTGLGNRVKRADEELAQKYQSGITMEPEQVQARKERVQELGLEEYVDDRYFLSKEYYGQYSIDELEKKGLTLLIECMTDEDIAMWQTWMNYGIAPMYIHASKDLIAWTDTTGATVRTHAFEVDGHVAFCGDHDKSAPATGAKHSAYITVTNKKIQKFLYYGYAGPDDRMTKAGYSRSKAYTVMAFSIDKLRKGERLGTTGTAFWNKIKDLPAPVKGRACYVETYGAGLQDLFFYTMPKKGKLQIEKTSADTVVTNKKTGYSLEGAEYGIYTKADCKSGRVAVLKTETDGVSGKVELQSGTYYVKEIKAPPGYALNSKIHTVKIISEETTVLKVKDKPQMNPIEVLLQKVDADTKKNNPQGNATLQGAQFTVKFYGGLWEKNTDPAKLGKKPLRTWVFQTDQDGVCKYSKSYLISGNSLYTSLKGVPSLPLGTVTIQETKASEGYLINHSVFILQIKSQGTAETVHTYNQPTIPENIFKLNLIKKQKGTEFLISGAGFEHTKPDGTTEFLKTNGKGEITIKGLPYGVHRLREISVMDGYEVNGTIIEFTVKKDNSVILSSKPEGLGEDVLFEIVKDGNIQIQVEDRLSPFCLAIHKVNDKNEKLDGAEFTLYEEKTCVTEAIKGKTVDGMLYLKGLLPEKKYYLKETKAPAGYRLPKDSFRKPVIYEIYTESIPLKDQFLFYVNGTAYDADARGKFTITGTKANREVNMAIENKRERKLPDTGSAGTILILLTGIGCLGAAAFCKKKIG